MQTPLASLELARAPAWSKFAQRVRERCSPGCSSQAEKCSLRQHTLFAVCGNGATPLGSFGIRSFEGELSSWRLLVLRRKLLKRPSVVRNSVTGSALRVWLKLCHQAQHFLTCIGMHRYTVIELVKTKNKSVTSSYPFTKRRINRMTTFSSRKF